MRCANDSACFRTLWELRNALIEGELLYVRKYEIVIRVQFNVSQSTRLPDADRFRQMKSRIAHCLNHARLFGDPSWISCHANSPRSERSSCWSRELPWQSIRYVNCNLENDSQEWQIVLCISLVYSSNIIVDSLS